MFGKISKISIANFLSAETRLVKKFPFKFGSSSSSDWVLGATSTPWSKSSVSFHKEGPKVVLKVDSAVQANGEGSAPLMLNGEFLDNPIELEKNKTYFLKIDDQFFAFSLTEELEGWKNSIFYDSWDIFNVPSNEAIATTRIYEVAETILNTGNKFEDCAVRPSGFDIPATWVSLLPDVVRFPEYQEVPEVEKHEENTATELPNETLFVPGQLSAQSGEFQCPICWLHFDGKDVYNIATHEELRGDDLLGPSEMRRFVPSRFDESGNPLDDFGVESPDTACPHCRHRLPIGFGEFKQNIFSIIGAPSSGKSYYLAILIHQLKRTLFDKFSLYFGDQDPEYNIELNAVTNKLFTASTPERGRIEKTQLKGGVYRNVIRQGKEVDLPKPYIFTSSNTNVENSESCLVFYDNAGEHFLPTNSTSEDYHILHIAKASALFFLYDPIASIDIKRELLGTVESDQLKLDNYASDNQDIILAQMNVKIKRALNMSFGSKLDVPLSIIIGKSDIWKSLLPPETELKDPLTNGLVDLKAIDSNSEIIRSFLARYSPSMVASAEKISSNVKFFSISAFGHKPESFSRVDPNTKTEIVDIAPDPLKIDPQMIEIPTIWALSQVAPHLIPSTEPENA